MNPRLLSALEVSKVPVDTRGVPQNLASGCFYLNYSWGAGALMFPRLRRLTSLGAFPSLLPGPPACSSAHSKTSFSPVAVCALQAGIGRGWRKTSLTNAFLGAEDPCARGKFLPADSPGALPVCMRGWGVPHLPLPTPGPGPQAELPRPASALHTQQPQGPSRHDPPPGLEPHSRSIL